MSINTRESYIEIGTSVNADNTLNNVKTAMGINYF